MSLTEQEFQSTLPHGSDTDTLNGSAQDFTFQSTLPHGSDHTHLGSQPTTTGISIHAPSRERHILQTFGDFITVFQSTLPHGSDIIHMVKDRSNLISIHAPSRERPAAKISKLICAGDFNPRSLTGATLSSL